MIMTRPRNESKEEKKLRKEAIKNERQARRVEKKLTKEQFSAEFERQKKTIMNKGNAKTRKL
jgi:protein LTV1